ncbi:hypothetical protein BGZ75_009156 [Mortierella antarctica]|nr:hypothetical protein BGZ75_009156 [Mortierella antarctica]
MPTPVSAPSFILLETEDHPPPSQSRPRTTSHHTAALDHAVVGLRRFTISRDRHHHPHPSPHKRRGRPANSRVRGKHGIVKAMSSYARTGYHRSVARCGNSQYNDSASSEGHSCSKETRTTLLRSYMQSRRLRLRQRLSRQPQDSLLDSSDMSFDEDEALDDSTEDDAKVFLSDPEQHRRQMWELEQRLLEKTESAAKSRSHFLMERRVSAGERVDHVQRVVQRRRTEQEMRQHKVRDELEQKMMRAMARRKEFLEAAIENDPSRRFRRKSASSSSSNAGVVSDRTRDRVRGSSSFSVAVAGSGSEPLSFRRTMASHSAAPTTTSLIIHNKTALVTAMTPNITERGQDEERGPKNSGRMDIMNQKSPLTSMTSRSISPSTAANDLILDDSIIKSSPSDIDGGGASVDNLGLERTTVWAQRRIRTRLVQKASHEYMRAIGGSHQRVLAMGFEDLARLLHSNKALVQAAVRFLKYSSQLAQMDLEPSQRTKRAHKNPGRVLLSMYMVLAHPNQIRSPSETTSATGHHDDDAFEALVESSKALLEALQTWMAANLKPHDDTTTGTENGNDSATRAPHSTAADSQRNAALVRNFDQAWTSYFGFFEAWKNKDARRLLETLLEHARQLEALWRTVQSDAMARVEWQPRIEEQRRDLRAKAGQLAGPSGVARLDSAFADFVTTTTTNTAVAAAAAAETNSPTSNSNSSSAAVSLTRASPTAEDAVMEETLTSTPGAKKRQRNASVSQPDIVMASADQVSNTLATATRSTDSSLMAEGNTDSNATQEPLPKKPATANPSAGASTAKKTAKETTADGHLTFELPIGSAKPEKWSNLRMLHEVALDPSLRIEQAPQGPDTDLVQRIEAMATKAYFDSIREDAAKGELGKWIPSILTSIRMQLLDMVPPGSATAHRVAEAFDLEFVQQQVDRKVYDVKAALEGVLDIMSKLCAPIRDVSIRQLQEDLQQVSQHPFQTEQGTSSSNTPTPKYTATSVSPKDLVSVLQGILELLEQMLMDMANFRLIAARPKLEQQAIPYEQDAFKTMLEDGETSLEATTTWLQTSATRFLSSKSTSPPSSPSETATSSSGSGSPGSASAKSGNRHYEVFANAVLDLLFSKKAVETLDKNEFPETFELDRMRLTRYQNEIQALLLVAVMMNMAFNSAPLVKTGEWSEELKSTLFKLMELSGTTKGQFADAIIEAKEKALLVAARSGSSSSPSSSSTSSPNPCSPTPTSSVSASQLLMTEDKKRSLHTSIAKAVSFDSPLYSVIAQRVRKVLERYLTSTSASGGMPDRAALNKIGLGFLEGELEVIAKPIRFLVKYNAKVYQQWYDPILAKALAQASETLSKASTEAPPAPAPASASSSSSSCDSV